MGRVSKGCGIIVLLSLFFAQSAEAHESDREAVSMTADKFVKEMQLLARRSPPGNTKLKQQETLAALQTQLHSDFDGVILEYDVRITAVDWKAEMATIRTTPPFRKYKPSARMPFNITPTQPLKIPMTREDAAAIRIGTPLSFRGKLKFLDGQWGSVGWPPKSQSLFWIRSEHYKSLPSIGTFISEDYAVEIAGSEVFAVHPNVDAE